MNLRNAERLFANKKFDKALVIFKGLIRKSPNSTHLLFRIGSINRLVGNHQLAEEYFKQVEKISPCYVWIHIERSHISAEQGCFQSALSHLDIAFRYADKSKPCYDVILELQAKYNKASPPYKRIESKFIPYIQNDDLESEVKLIAFFFPQFHSFPENDEFWGKGFTDWTNVKKAKPCFEGHYQPHKPIHQGHYNLLDDSVMVEQANLAKNYGVHGFNYYFYWFDGRSVMEEGLKKMLRNPAVDIPFCLTWANENWTRRWDGGNGQELLTQNHRIDDFKQFIEHVIPYFRDPRYIKVDGKPMLTIYRCDLIPNIAEVVLLFRTEILKHGFPGIHLVCVRAFGLHGAGEFGFDATMGFPPHDFHREVLSPRLDISPGYVGHVLDYSKAVDMEIVKNRPLNSTNLNYDTLVLGWDNSARQPTTSTVYANFTYGKFEQWLEHSAEKIVHSNVKDKFVFINAWNEWAEGTHLEPDLESGYAGLQAVYNVVKKHSC
jgi:hypothetical protein